MTLPSPTTLAELAEDPSFIQKLMTYSDKSRVMYDILHPSKRPTLESICDDVVKLRSISVAGMVWIADERCRRESVRPYHNTFRFKIRGTPY